MDPSEISATVSAVEPLEITSADLGISRLNRPKLLVYWDSEEDLLEFLAPLKTSFPELLLSETNNVKGLVTAIDREHWDAVLVANLATPRRVARIILELMSVKAPHLQATVMLRQGNSAEEAILLRAGAAAVFTRSESNTMLFMLSGLLELASKN